MYHLFYCILISAFSWFKMWNCIGMSWTLAVVQLSVSSHSVISHKRLSSPCDQTANCHTNTPSWYRAGVLTCSILTMLCAVMTNKESSEQTVWAQHFPCISLGTRSETLLADARSHLMLLVSPPPRRALERFRKRNSSWKLEVFGVWPSAAITRFQISSVTY
jgi:hypothetical protein